MKKKYREMKLMTNSSIHLELAIFHENEIAVTSLFDKRSFPFRRTMPRIGEETVTSNRFRYNKRHSS